ncbi:MAG TPA: amidohydrolase family protein [Candidatus Acidoferrales bacterium]|nr:amidohydrolase family protein [Candidatus Acidoferrales bacterium]
MNRRKFLESSSALISAGALGAAAGGAAGEPARPGGKLRLVATEEAFATPEQVDFFRRAAASSWADPDVVMWRSFLGNETILRRLLDVETERLSIMDQFGINVHLLSLTSPGVQLLDADAGTALARSANDRLAETVKKHPARFAGLATFAPQDPNRAAKEIDRAINDLKLNGMIVNSHTNSEYLDNQKYWAIFEALSALNVPLYIHPRNVPQHVEDLMDARLNLDGAIWGFQMDTGLHAMRLIVSGVFDKFPNLQIVLGHMGEAVPYWLYRMDYMYNVYTAAGRGRTRTKKMPSEYVKKNFMITTSGVNDHTVLKFCHEVLGPENVMFAIDYPYQETKGAAEFITSAPLPQADLEKIAHANAERVFRIPSA